MPSIGETGWGWEGNLKQAGPQEALGCPGPARQRLQPSGSSEKTQGGERDRGQSGENKGSELKRLWAEIRGPGLQDPGTSQHLEAVAVWPHPASLREGCLKGSRCSQL